MSVVIQRSLVAVGSIIVLWILWMPVIRASKRRTMAAIEVVNLRRDFAALRDDVDTLRRYLSSLCTTHEQERVKAPQALDSHEWQCQDADGHATRAIMRIQALEAGARVDTLEDTASMALKKMLTKEKLATTSTTPMIDAQIKALIAKGVADALAERSSDRSKNGDDNHDSGSDGRRRMSVLAIAYSGLPEVVNP
ncbi:hypothetical protein Tco_0875075 [Tanacetum coccineum]|uniref:Uncharacterized protein n=1 Tax=Tanacetum coccineum TaxID=301880 RepID=A0ABQ5BQ66_9ASTR